MEKALISISPKLHQNLKIEFLHKKQLLTLKIILFYVWELNLL